MHIVSLRQTFDQTIMKVLPGLKEIWSGHESQGSNSTLIVTLTLSLHDCIMASAHSLTDANI